MTVWQVFNWSKLHFERLFEVGFWDFKSFSNNQKNLSFEQINYFLPCYWFFWSTLAMSFKVGETFNVKVGTKTLIKSWTGVCYVINRDKLTDIRKFLNEPVISNRDQIGISVDHELTFVRVYIIWLFGYYTCHLFARRLLLS